jgi:hypothetical protein
MTVVGMIAPVTTVVVPRLAEWPRHRTGLSWSKMLPPAVIWGFRQPVDNG